MFIYYGMGEQGVLGVSWFLYSFICIIYGLYYHQYHYNHQSCS